MLSSNFLIMSNTPTQFLTWIFPRISNANIWLPSIFDQESIVCESIVSDILEGSFLIVVPGV